MLSTVPTPVTVCVYCTMSIDPLFGWFDHLRLGCSLTHPLLKTHTCLQGPQRCQCVPLMIRAHVLVVNARTLAIYLVLCLNGKRYTERLAVPSANSMCTTSPTSQPANRTVALGPSHLPTKRKGCTVLQATWLIRQAGRVIAKAQDKA